MTSTSTSTSTSTEPAVRTIGQALNDVLRAEMAADDTVICIGENVAAAGGSFAVTKGLLDEYGPRRIFDTPISEAGFTGMAIGAAATGLRPVIDMMFSDFALLAMDQIMNQAAHLRYMTGGQLAVPMVVRCPSGAGAAYAAQHSQSLAGLFAYIPGLKVVVPSTPADAAGLLRTAIRDLNPVLFFEQKTDYGRRGPVPAGDHVVPFGVADVKRPGDDVTVVATSSMVHVALAAAEAMAGEVSVEVVDPRTLSPLDVEGLAASVRRTGRCVVVDEGHRSFGPGAELAATVAEHAFDWLEEPVRRVCGADTPVPFATALERAFVPSVDAVVGVIRGMRR